MPRIKDLSYLGERRLRPGCNRTFTHPICSLINLAVSTHELIWESLITCLKVAAKHLAFKNGISGISDWSFLSFISAALNQFNLWSWKRENKLKRICRAPATLCPALDFLYLISKKKKSLLLPILGDELYLPTQPQWHPLQCKGRKQFLEEASGAVPGMEFVGMLLARPLPKHSEPQVLLLKAGSSTMPPDYKPS